MSGVAELIPVNAEIEIDLQALAVESGRPFRGTVQIHPRERLEVEEVKVVAKVTEAWEEDHWERDASGTLHTSLRRKEEPLYMESVKLSGSLPMSPGSPRSFPFEVTVPKFQPSRSGGAVSYELDANVLVKGRPALSKTVSALVVPGPISRASIIRGITMTRVVPKEVVVVPCEVCKTLVPLTVGVDRCPKCGRPLRIG